MSFPKELHPTSTGDLTAALRRLLHGDATPDEVADLFTSAPDATVLSALWMLPGDTGIPAGSGPLRDSRGDGGIHDDRWEPVVAAIAAAGGRHLRTRGTFSMTEYAYKLLWLAGTDALAHTAVTAWNDAAADAGPATRRFLETAVMWAYAAHSHVRIEALTKVRAVDATFFFTKQRNLDAITEHVDRVHGPGTFANADACAGAWPGTFDELCAVVAPSARRHAACRERLAHLWRHVVMGAGLHPDDIIALAERLEHTDEAVVTLAAILAEDDIAETAAGLLDFAASTAS